MDRNLEFLETLTVEQFKRAHGVERIEVKQSPKTGLLFIQFGAEVGACSSKGIPKRPMLSKVKGDPTERNPSGIFWMLHEEGTGGAPVLATF